MGRHLQPERRATLLDACTRHVLAHGLAGLSVASMAAAAGTSPRMLIYHFTTKDQLISEVLHDARRRQRVLFDGLIEPRPGVPYPAVVRAAWPRISGPEAMPYHNLFRELHNLPPEMSPWQDFAAKAADDWLPTIEAGLRADGYPDPTPLATMILATIRGLLLDLHVTSDHARVDHAVDIFIDLLDQPVTRHAAST
jgi:AcrR family transcriptional regulator